MKLDTRAIRYLTAEDWRVLTAVEMGSKNHEVVPTNLIGQIAGLRGGSGVHKSISALAKVGLIAKVKNAKYDGYRLTYGGLDYLALNAHRKSDTIFSLGDRIGVGKESDIYVCASPSGQKLVLKIHRLGRISFRTVKANRDYLRNRSSASWMYMSRLAALKEYAFLKALWDEGFPVPKPVGQSRHTVVMNLVDAPPMRQIKSVPDPATLYADLIALILRLARVGLIHGDFNEFNILIEERGTTEATSSETTASQESPSDTSPNGAVPESSPSVTCSPVIIDFPQMVSISHQNAEYYFDRDVACIKRFFERRFGFVSDEEGPFFSDAVKDVGKRLDIQVEASGFSKKMAKELERYMEEVGATGDAEKDAQEDGANESLDEHGEEDEPEESNDHGDVEGPVQDPVGVESENPSDDLQGGMRVLEIRDMDAAHDAPLPPQKLPSSKPRSTAKAAGWSI